jgi:hypothetical protein
MNAVLSKGALQIPRLIPAMPATPHVHHAAAPPTPTDWPSARVVRRDADGVLEPIPLATIRGGANVRERFKLAPGALKSSRVVVGEGSVSDMPVDVRLAAKRGDASIDVLVAECVPPAGALSVEASSRVAHNRSTALRRRQQRAVTENETFEFQEIHQGENSCAHPVAAPAAASALQDNIAKLQKVKREHAPEQGIGRHKFSKFELHAGASFNLESDRVLEDADGPKVKDEPCANVQAVFSAAVRELSVDLNGQTIAIDDDSD